MSKRKNNPWHMGFIPEYAGWIPQEDRTVECEKKHRQYIFDTPVVDDVFTSPGYNKDRPAIWQVTKKAIEKGYVPDEYIRKGQFKNISQIIGSCFKSGTMVSMADGTEKAIQNIEVGDYIISHTNNKRKVVKTFRRQYYGTLHTFHVKNHNTPVTMTDDHDCIVVLTENNKFKGIEKRKARDVKPYDFFLLTTHSGDDFVETPYGYAVQVEKIDLEEVEDYTVYCCEVEEEHSLIVNGLAEYQCVGFGAGNMLLWASLIDAIIRQQQERILVPFVPYIYGRGRHHSGIHGPGSGSLGSGQAEALEKDGYIAWDMKGLPEPTFGDAIYWTKDIEYTWSDGARIDEKWIEKGQEHTVPTVVRVTDTEQARKLADNFYTFTIASDWGGRMKCPVKHGVLLNDRVGVWHHQLHCIDYVTHPKLGIIWWIGNQWKYPHGVDPGGPWDDNTGAPEGGFYITDRELQYILSQKDSFGFADPQGFEDRSRVFDWIMT